MIAAGTVDAIFPDALYLHLVRHPFYFARSAADWNRRPFTLDRLRSDLGAWVDYLRKNRERASTGRHILLPYERLVGAPEVILANV